MCGTAAWCVSPSIPGGDELELLSEQARRNAVPGVSPGLLEDDVVRLRRYAEFSHARGYCARSDQYHFITLFDRGCYLANQSAHLFYVEFSVASGYAAGSNFHDD